MDDLIQRARTGDASAFVELFERSKQQLWSAAVAVLGNTDDAADALQETTVKAWRAMPRFGGRSSVGTWLMRILLRVCFDMRKDRQREVPYAPSALGAGVGTGAGTSSDVGAPLVSSQIHMAEERALVGRSPSTDADEAMDVRRALGCLSQDDRLVLALFYANDLPTRQIAAILDISEGAVRTRLVRARARFKTAYCASGVGDGQDDEGKAEVAR